MSDDLSHYIPRRLDDAPKFLFWEVDVAMVALLGVLMGIGSGYPVLGVLIGFVAAYAYGQLKAGKHPGMAAHLLYWFTGFPEPTDLPGSHIRELNG